MVKVSYIDFPTGSEDKYFKVIKQTERFVNSSVGRNKPFVSRKKRAKLIERTLLKTISETWNTLDSSVVETWNTCGSLNNLTGFQLFVKDYSARVKAGISGFAVPSLLHQSKIGRIKIDAESLYFKIKQKHPHNYWLLKKVTNKKTMKEPVFVTEDFVLPLTFGINYFSSLSVAGSNPFAKLFVTIRSSYEGADKYTNFEIDFDYSSNWVNVENVISSVLGYVVEYELCFEIQDLQGSIYFDNINLFHSGQNWAIDSFCETIEKKHAKPFKKILSAWEDVNVPEFSNYKSIYKDF